MQTLVKGAALIIARPLLQEDGETAVPLASLTAAKVELIQGGTTAATYIKDTDDELRDSATEGTLWLELTPTLTASLSRGPLTFRWTLSMADDNFTESSTTYTDVWEETLVLIK